MKITEFVKDNQTAEFHYYRNSILYYRVIRYVDDKPENMYLFPVDTSDLDGATVNYTEKAIHMMRYIRKALKDGTMTQLSLPFAQYLEKNLKPV